ncbi:unnamed protein product, partial [Discosporangium mesarthrocarpum]
MHLSGCLVVTAGLHWVTGAWGLSSCAGYPKPTYRWLTEARRLMVEGDGSCVTLPDMFAAAPSYPLVPLNIDGAEDVVDSGTGLWLLTKTLYIENGVTLLLHSDQGCKELRLASNQRNVVILRTNGGYLSLRGTKVFSWDRSGGMYDRGHPKGNRPRSYISVVSEEIDTTSNCAGRGNYHGPHGRMDIVNSEVGYLGYNAAEAYGISYKVHGFCEADRSNPEIFEKVQVTGNIRFSDIHHNWFGIYSFGHQDGLWEYNNVHHNGYYGFDPHDDSDHLRIHNNNVYNNGWHSIIASKRCNDVSIQNNIVYNGNAHGIMLHRGINNAIVRNNSVISNADACIAVFESFDVEVSSNKCEGNT